MNKYLVRNHIHFHKNKIIFILIKYIYSYIILFPIYYKKNSLGKSIIDKDYTKYFSSICFLTKIIFTFFFSKCYKFTKKYEI